MRSRVHIVVRGRVHGVFFRAHTAERATALGLTGWVRNVPRGVEIIAEGGRPKLEKLIAWCKEGPPAAAVESVDVAWQKPGKQFKSFEIRY